MGNIFKYSNVGGFKTTTHYPDMLAGNTVWNPYSPTGAYDALATVTVPSGGVSSITFSGIPSTYTHLQLRGMVLAPSLGGSGVLRLNSDSGSNYSEHFIEGTGASVTANNGTNMTGVDYPFITGNTTAPGVSILDILDYANTNKYKTLRNLDGADANGSGYITFASYGWRSTAAITSISFTGTFAQYSTFSLYGVK